MQARRMFITTLLCGALIAPAVAGAGNFQGTIKMRNIAVSTGQLSTLLNGKPANAENVFGIPIEKVADVKGATTGEPMIYLSGSKVRADVLGPHQQGYMIMDLDQGTSWMVMPEKKKYVEWTKADLQALNDKMAQMKKEMEKRMAGMPPEQRKQMEAMMGGMKGMKGMPGAAAAPKPEIRPLNKTETINGMHATGYALREGGETTWGWVTKEQPDLMEAFKTFQEKQEKMMPGHEHGEKNARALLAEHGFPILTQQLFGQRYVIQEVTAIEKKPVAADMFTVPSGFEKMSPRQMMHHGGAHP